MALPPGNTCQLIALWGIMLHMSDLDDVDRRLLMLLQDDARRGFRELGRIIEMSPPAVAARVRRLERLGVITGYSARVDPTAVGFPTQAFIVVTTSGRAQSLNVVRMARNESRIIEDHRVTGGEDHFLRVVAEDLGSLEPLIDQLNELGKPATSLVLSSPKPWSPVPSPRP